MKNLIFIFFAIFAVSLTSCNSDDSVALKPSNEITDNGESGTIELRSDNDGGKKVECTGSCPSENCYARFLIQAQSYDCLPCSDCKMKITYLNSVDDYEYQSDIGQIGTMFNERMTNLHGGAEAKITSIVMQHSEDKEFIQFEYYIGENENEIYSVGYLTPIITSAIGPVVEIDCHGNCDTSVEICTEVFNTSSGEVYCKCESDHCLMTVTTSDN